MSLSPKPYPSEKSQLDRPRVFCVLFDREESGGDVYEGMIVRKLKQKIQFIECRIAKRIHLFLGGFSGFCAMLRVSFTAPRLAKQSNAFVCLLNFDAALLPISLCERRVVVVHHLDFRGNKYQRFYERFENQVYAALQRASIIVVVSEFWRKFLEGKGFHNVRTIYNAFPVDKFSFDDEEIHNFKIRFDLTQKPIIYLGNVGELKGYREAFEEIKEINAHFVITGLQPGSEGAIRRLHLPYRDYLRLLKASTLVLTMSKFNEGWCRTAHEAMLTGTPVIGSGKGGMRELLEGGGQVLCESFSELNTIVSDMLASPELRKAHGVMGYQYAKQFTEERFALAWEDLFEDLVSKKIGANGKPPEKIY